MIEETEEEGRSRGRKFVGDDERAEPVIIKTPKDPKMEPKKTAPKKEIKK